MELYMSLLFMEIKMCQAISGKKKMHKDVLDAPTKK